MNKIIKGRRYDTETAQEVCGYFNDELATDLFYWEETLYVKRTGEFFLHRWGGLGTTEPGRKIIPLTEEQAKEFCEKYADGDTYEQYFGVVEDNTERLSATLTAANMKKLKSLAVEQKRTVSELLNRMIEKL